MAFRVDLAERAIRDLRHILEHLAADRSKAAAAWFDGLEAAIRSTGEHPFRGAAVPEDRRLRQLLYGRRPGIYRIIYDIDEGGRVVTVLHIRHGARDMLSSDPPPPEGD